MNKKDIRDMMYGFGGDDEPSIWYSLEELKKHGSNNYWAGCAIGAIGMLILCLIIGYYT